MLEDTKREVREIRAAEAQARWNLTRDEKKERVYEEKTETEEIRDWRWKQSDEMKVFVDEQDHEIRTVELKESKDFQEFKREYKKDIKEEEQKFIHEVYVDDTDHAAWRAELAREASRRERELVVEKVEEVQETRELRQGRQQQEQAIQEQERALEQSLEISNLARQLALEKEQLLQTLEYTRGCQRATAPAARRDRQTLPVSGRRPSP